MGTTIRPEVSEKNKYKISKHRYYELLHFCRQYNDYVLERRKINETYIQPVLYSENKVMTDTQIDRTENFAIKLANIDDKIRMIEETAIEAGEDLSGYLLMAVSSGISYETLKTMYNIPCSRNTFYDMFRKFFWLLDKKRG